MGMLLTSNSTANALVSPDGFNPPFSLEGCEYIGLYDKDPAVNFAPGKPQPSVVGSLVREGVGIKTRASVNYIDTNIVPGTGDLTIITVFDRASAKAKVGDTGGRVWVVSSYSGAAGEDVGASVSLEGRPTGEPDGPPITASVYRSVSANGEPTRETLVARGGIQMTRDFSIYVGQSWKDPGVNNTRCKIINMNNEGSASGLSEGKIPAKTSATLKVGSAVSTVPDPAASSVTMYCTMIFKRNLTVEELRVIRTWLYDYYRRRGVSGI